MLDLIQKLSTFNRATANGRSLTQVKAGARKRTRKQFNADQELSTKLELRYAKKQQLANDPFAFVMPKRGLPKH